MSEPDAAASHALRAGLRAEAVSELAGALGSEPGERAVAEAIVRSIAASRLAGTRVLSDADVRSAEPPAEPEGQASDGQGLHATERSHDVRVLVATLRAGSLPQQRAAAARLGQLLLSPQAATVHAAEEALDALTSLRASRIEYELFHVLVRMPGGAGRKARAEGARWEAASQALLASVRAFWEGELEHEPVVALASDERARILVRARDLSETAVRHVSAVIEGTDGVSGRAERAVVLHALVPAGDARLLPALRRVLERPDDELAIPAAAALGMVADPRALSALREAYARTSAAELRLVLAAALGMHRDGRALGLVREVIAAGDESLLPLALDALRQLGGRDDVQALTALLGHAEPAVVNAAVRTLGGIADGRALIPLADLDARTDRPALRATVDEARQAITARIELLGEAAPTIALRAHGFDTARRTAQVLRKDPATVRMRALGSYWLGRLWLLLGARQRGVGRMEIAAALRSDWVAPLLSLALTHARREELPQALSSFRRALRVDPKRVVRQAASASLLAHTFLRRAEHMEREGRVEIARGLLEEALGFDLRLAPIDLRLALEQRLSAIAAQRALSTRPT